MRIQLVISPSEVERLDAWRASRRIWSRSEAIRQLVAEGIERDEQAENAAKRDGRMKT